jgi:hypothetical protein
MASMLKSPVSIHGHPFPGKTKNSRKERSGRREQNTELELRQAHTVDSPLNELFEFFELFVADAGVLVACTNEGNDYNVKTDDE